MEMSMGEHQKVIASADKLVVDPANGTLRQIVAGQEVPSDLLEAEEGDKSIVGFEGPEEEAAPAKAEPAKAAPASKR
jgi:hypothetical protein